MEIRETSQRESRRNLRFLRLIDEPCGGRTNAARHRPAGAAFSCLGQRRSGTRIAF